MMNCYSALYVRGFWPEKPQSIHEAASTVADLFVELKNADPSFDNIRLLMNEGQKDSLYDLRKISKSELRDKLVNDILLKSREAIKEYHPAIEPGPDFSEPIGFNLFFFTGQEDKAQQFTIDLRIGAYEGWNNNIDFTFPRNIDKSFEWYSHLLDIILNIFPVQKAGVYPEYTMRLKGKPQEFPGWITYYSKDFDMPGIPPFVQVKENDLHGGRFYILTTEDFDIKNQIHIEKWKTFYLEFLKKYPITNA